MNVVQDSGCVLRKEAVDRSSRAPRPLGQHARQIGRDASSLVTELRETAADAEHLLTARMKHHPWTTLAAAAGAGYVLGGGLRTRFTVLLLGAAARLASALAMRELGDRMGPRPSSAADQWKP